MKRIFVLVSVCLCLLGSAISVWAEEAKATRPVDLAAENYRIVVDDIASQVVATLPDDIHFRLLGIAPVEGDDGALVDALTSKIKTGTRFHLVERKDLDQILSEQGLQLSPIVDPRRPIEPGRIQGVEGLLLGAVTKKQCSFLFCNLEVFIKLNDVEGGEVKFARSFSAQYLPMSTKFGGAVLVILVLAALYLMSRKKRGIVEAAHSIRKDEAKLLDMQSALKMTRDNLERSHDELVAANKMNLSIAVREVKGEVVALLARIEQAPSLHLENTTRQLRDETRGHAKSMANILEDVFYSSEKVLQGVRDGADNQVQRALETLRAEMTDASNLLHERIAGRA